MVEEWEERQRERIGELSEELDGFIEDQGTENLIIGMNQRPYLLIDEDQAHSLSLAELQRFPLILSDLILTSQTNPVTLDFHLYWGWTAAYMAHHMREEENVRDVLEDFYSMVHLCLFPIRQTTMDDRVAQFIRSMNQSTMGIATMGMSFSATGGFSILEGILRRHVSGITDKGHWNGPEIDDPPWKESPIPVGGRLSYYDILQLWRHYEARENVAITLDKIDDLDRYDEKLLSRKMAGVGASLEEESRTDILSILADQRNANIHGEMSTSVVGSLVLTLCCLALWDWIDEADFKERREDIVESIGRDGARGRVPPMMSGIHPRWPSSFYPI